MRNEALETMDHDEAIVEEVRTGDLHSVNEDLILTVGGDGEAAVGGERLDFGSEDEGFEEVEGVKAWERELLEEEREGAGGQVRREASEGAKTVRGVVAERLAEAAAEESSWNPRVERMVAKRAGE
ncbi:UNVERIFIED_CONTAM: hypothetical protein Sangu_1066900 [Sesamum angustifolium]|uniref:Uncharacterized protein n=1 Tax=Sesamum angustifolium TaxID=2727405 RepID=A0AAW2NYV2_9LAMI